MNCLFTFLNTTFIFRSLYFMFVNIWGLLGSWFILILLKILMLPILNFFQGLNKNKHIPFNFESFKVWLIFFSKYCIISYNDLYLKELIFKHCMYILPYFAFTHQIRVNEFKHYFIILNNRDILTNNFLPCYIIK